MGHSGWDCKSCGHKNKRKAEHCICGRHRHDRSKINHHPTELDKGSKAKQPVVKPTTDSKS